jgi:maleylacetoacetate isomerase
MIIFIILFFLIMENSSKYSNFVLYSFWRSSATWRVRIALNFKKVKYEIKIISLFKGENLTEEFQKKNPIKRVPVLQFTDENGKEEYLMESLGIVEFLEELYPENSLLSKDPVERAKIRAICDEIACNIQPLQNLPVLEQVGQLGSDKDEWAREWIKKGLTAIESLVEKTKGKFCFGDRVTLADIFLIPQLYNARRFKLDVSQYPLLLDIEKNASQLEEFIQADANNQIDAEK